MTSRFNENEKQTLTDRNKQSDASTFGENEIRSSLEETKNASEIQELKKIESPKN